MLEDFEHIMGISMKGKVPFADLEERQRHEITTASLHIHKRDMTPNLETKGSTQGFSIKFLVEKALTFVDAKNLEAFNTVVALSIYGIVLFHNIDNFNDISSICIFLTKNPIPTLFVDIYYFLNVMHEKKWGMVLCCARLSYKWIFFSPPEEGTFCGAPR